MALKWILVAAIATIAVAGPVNKLAFTKDEVLRTLKNPTAPGERNPLIEGIISNALEDLRQTMLTGTDTIPILDPFQLDRISADDQLIPIPGASIEINDLTVNKLSTFVIAELAVSTAWPWITRYNVVLDGYIPELYVDAGQLFVKRSQRPNNTVKSQFAEVIHKIFRNSTKLWSILRNYDLSMDVFGLNVFGNGDARIKFIEPRLRLNLQIGVTISLTAVSVVVRECNVVISLTDVLMDIKGLFNNPLVDTFVNLFLRNLILEMLEVFSNDITQRISPIVMDVANGILADLNLIDFIGTAQSQKLGPPVEF